MPAFDLRKLYDPVYDKGPPISMKKGADAVWLKVRGSNIRVRIPSKMSGKLAHVIGIILGDGYISDPIPRKVHGAGFHWKV